MGRLCHQFCEHCPRHTDCRCNGVATQGVYWRNPGTYCCFVAIGNHQLRILLFQKDSPHKIKFYIVSLVMALVPTYMLTFHPEATSRRYPYPEFNRAVEFVGIVFFGGGGLCVLYKDIMWHLKHKSKKKHSNTSRKPHKKQEKHVHC